MGTSYGTCLLTAVLVMGCSTSLQLTAEGERVRHVSRADMPTSCNLLGDVAIGIPPDAARPRTEEELSILLRNKAGREGGNHVVTDMSERREDSNGAPYFRGRGIAYACSEETMRSPDDGERSAGGEDTGGPDEGDDAPRERSDEEDDVMEDLLGE